MLSVFAMMTCGVCLTMNTSRSECHSELMNFSLDCTVVWVLFLEGSFDQMATAVYEACLLISEDFVHMRTALSCTHFHSVLALLLVFVVLVSSCLQTAQLCAEMPAEYA